MAEKIVTLKSSIPYLVKGKSAKTNEDVIGFPYVYIGSTAGGNIGHCNIIISPSEIDKAIGVDGKFAICFDESEIHPIIGPMYRYSYNEGDAVVFEDAENVKEMIAKASLEAAGVKEDENLDTENNLLDVFKKVSMAKFIEGVKWAAQHGITLNMIENAK